MTKRATTIATLLMIGAAMAATPSLAQGNAVAGNPGPADQLVLRNAPFTVPGDVQPMPMPTLSDATSRNLFGTDPEAALETVGTATLDRSGEVTETPASDALRSAFLAWVEGNRGN